MKVPARWLNSYLTKKLTTRQLADAMELAGIEVEAVLGSPQWPDSIVVGEVVAEKPHPDADRLKVVQIEVGSGQPLEIVCGAPNIGLGQKVVVAKVGSVLPDQTAITRSKIRGVVSDGMVCSAKELGLGDDHSGILVLDYETKTGQSLSKAWIDNDVIDTTTAANRWDLNGLVYIAREVAAQTSQKIAFKQPEQLKSSSAGPKLAAIDARLAPRYALAELEVNPTAVTPPEITGSLLAAGIRPISIVVDITNYVMLEQGQPLHAFNAEAVKGPVGVRLAHQKERLTTLDDQERQLTAEDIVITDSSGPIALAGVMGGASTEVTAATKRILLEAATFDPAKLRATALRLGLRTDASARFERRLPPTAAGLALARAVQLLEKHAGAKLVGASYTRAKAEAPTVIKVDTGQVSGFLGLDVTPSAATKALAGLGWQVRGSGSMLEVAVPWWRPDVSEWADVAEELIKLIGYDKLPATIPAWKPESIKFDRIWNDRWRAKSVLQSLGLFEVTTYSFISQNQITALGWDPADFLKLKNPLSTEQAYLRCDLLPSLLATTEANRAYSKEFGLYELSKVYAPSKRGELPHEPQRLGVVMVSQKGGYLAVKAALDRLTGEFNLDITLRPEQFDREVAHPTRSATISAGGKKVGVICQLHPALVASTKISGEVGYLEVDWESLVAAAKVKTYYAPSRFPAIRRDLSLVVKREVLWQQIEAGLSDYSPKFMGDYYGVEAGADRKVVTVRLTFSAPDHTLEDKEADQLQQQALKALGKSLTFKLRD